MMVENIHICKAHAHKTLVQAGSQIFSAAPVPVRAVPHGVARLGADDQLVAVGVQLFPQDAAEVALGAARLRAVVVGEVKMVMPWSNAVKHMAFMFS